MDKDKAHDFAAVEAQLKATQAKLAESILQRDLAIRLLRRQNRDLLADEQSDSVVAVPSDPVLPPQTGRTQTAKAIYQAVFSRH